MLNVDLDNIITQDELASRADEILRKADEEKKIVVVTRGGRPAVAILKIEELEALSGRSVTPNLPTGSTPSESGTPAWSSAPAALPSMEAPAPAAEAPLPAMGMPVSPLEEPLPGVATETVVPPVAPIAEMTAPVSPMANPTGLPDMPAETV
jgi:hypothetical protein